MRFLIDECIAPTTAELLRQLGHDVLDVKGINRSGITDLEVYRIACEQNRTIFTTDKGFRQFDPARCGGIIISATRPNTPLRYEPRLKHLLNTTRHEELMGALVFLEEKRHRFIRSRR